jgi:hemoglobin/transferrin/lactoferrin receptor protein
MKKAIVIAFLTMGIGLCAQTLTVKDKSSLQALPGVKINNQETNEKGHIELSMISIDKTIFSLYHVSKQGYFSDSFTIKQLQDLNYTVYLSESTHDWSGIVVSASRFEEDSRDIAQQLTVVNQKQMQFLNQPTTADLIQQSGRAFVQKSQMGGGSVVMRGFEANKVLMVVDGVRMNNAIYRGGHLQNVLSVDNNMLEKTEMLFGPGSVIYGSDALGGVIHFYTKKPVLSSTSKPSFAAMAFTRYGSAMNEKTAHFDFNIGLKKFAFLSSATISNFGDMRIGKNGVKGYESWGRRTFRVERINGQDSMVVNKDSFNLIPSGYTQWDLMQKVLFKPNKYSEHVLNLQHSNTTDIPRYDRLSELRGGLPRQGDWYYGPQTRTLASYNYAISKKTAAFEKANIILAYQDIKESRHTRSFKSNNLSNRNEHVQVSSLNADFQKDLGVRTEMRYGLEYLHNTVNSSGDKEHIVTGEKSAIDTRYPDGGSIMSSMAVYISQNTYFSKNLIVNTGIRFTSVYLNSKFDSKTFFPFLSNEIEQRNQNTSGNIGLVYNAKNDLKLTATLASGFRAPNVDDMAKVFESVGGRIIIPNRNLRPEQTNNIDLGIQKIFMKKLSVEVNAFYTQFTNALTLGRAQLNGQDTIVFDGQTSTIYTTQNAQEAYIYGLYFGLNYDVNKAISINGAVNYTYGRIITDTTDYPLDHISPVYGRLGIVYKHKKWKGELFILFNGAKRSKDYNLLGEDNQVYSADPLMGYNPAWLTLNVRGFYQINKLLQVQLAVENILDQHYRTFSSGYSAPGRNFVVTLRGNF